MGVEILESGQVIVKRPDAAELVEIRNGGWNYEALVAYADTMGKRIDQAYKTTKLPRSVDHVRLNEHYHHMLSDWGF